MNHRQRFAGEVVLATITSAGLALLAFRQGPLLTFDGYHYVEFTKSFATAWPDRFGNHWPFGFPLLGSLLVRLGVPSYPALLILSSLALAGWLLFTGLILPPQLRWRGFLLVAFGSAPIVAAQLAGVLTELPFATALLGLIFSFAYWPSRRALWASAGCAVLALGIRYVGLIALVAFSCWGLVQWRTLRQAGRLGTALLAWASAAGVSLGLLALNVVKSGYASGAERGHPAGLRDFPAQFSDFGWSLPSALVAGGIRDRIGAETAPGLALGAFFSIFILAWCAEGWLRPRSIFSRPLALVGGGYATGMMVLHCIGDFDALHNGRTFLPVLAPLGLLLCERLAVAGRWLFCGGALIVASGTIAAGRGISRQINADVHDALPPLRRTLAPGDAIAINDNAFTVAAYFSQPVIRASSELWAAHPNERFLVAAGAPLTRDGRGGVCPPEWAALAAELNRSGRYRYLLQTSNLLVLERIGPSPSAR